MRATSVEERIVNLLKEKGLKITTMESCTSGLLISTITDIEGASSITEGGYVTYSNEAKITEGVPAYIINKMGVYSTATAIAMASSCKAKRKADIGIGVTGTFSNVDPNNADSKSGEVYYCIDMKDIHFKEKILLPNEFEHIEGVTTRHQQKVYVVKYILTKLEDLLINGCDPELNKRVIIFN